MDDALPSGHCQVWTSASVKQSAHPTVHDSTVQNTSPYVGSTRAGLWLRGQSRAQPPLWTATWQTRQMSNDQQTRGQACSAGCSPWPPALRASLVLGLRAADEPRAAREREVRIHFTPGCNGRRASRASDEDPACGRRWERVLECGRRREADGAASSGPVPDQKSLIRHGHLATVDLRWFGWDATLRWDQRQACTTTA